MVVERVVSLIPSSTEIVCALGCETLLVGRSHECDFPQTVKRLPVCTEPKFRADGTSDEIDRRVKAILQDALSVYRVHGETLHRLQPQVILTQSQCEVCAVSLREVEQALCSWLESRPAIVSLEPRALRDVFADIERVAQALNVPGKGAALVQRMKRRMQEIEDKTRTLPARPTVVCIEWLEPLMAAGNWMPELVRMAGGENVFGLAGEHSPWMTWEQLLEMDPDVAVVLPCGFDIRRSRENICALTSKSDWWRLRAVHSRRVYLTDGNQYFNRPGPRLVQSLEILAEILHPGLFEFGHHGSGWQRIDD